MRCQRTVAGALPATCSKLPSVNIPNCLQKGQKMEIVVTRQPSANGCTIGTMNIDGAFECYTLEDVVRPNGEKVYGQTAIPEGRYQIKLTMSNRFKIVLPLLENVPNFEGVRIHPGNTAADTDGCILVGQTKTNNSIGSSRVAFDKLFSRLQAHKGEIWLTVK